MRYALLLLATLAAVPVSPLRANDANDANTLRAVDASWNDLRLKADVAGLDKLLAEDWLLTHSDGRVQDKKEYLHELSSRTRSNHAIEKQDVRVRRYGDTAVVTGTSMQAGTRDGASWSGRFRFTRLWILREGHWQMVSSHSSRIALDDIP